MTHVAQLTKKRQLKLVNSVNHSHLYLLTEYYFALTCSILIK